MDKRTFPSGHFAQRAVCPDELPGIMRRHIYTGALGNVWGFLISGVFFIYFGNAIGMSPADWGVLMGLSSFLLSAEVLSAEKVLAVIGPFTPEKLEHLVQ